MVDAIRADDGTLIGFAKITRDLTERREAQLQLDQSRQLLFQSQKMEAVGQLTGGLAHDFNNLLTGISGSLELARARAAQGRFADVDRLIAAAQGASARAAALTHRLLAFARRQTLDPKATKTNRLVGDVKELLERTVGPEIMVEIKLAPGLWDALCDANQLENAILNLCINARDAMPDGGRLIIATANASIGAGDAAKYDMEPGDYVAVDVRDTGTGMPADVIERAFDPFFTTKPTGQGTGLGLSMVYGFAKQSGGQVRIESEVGVGTTVRIYLPRHEGEAAHDEPEPVPATMPRAEAGQTVLIVDDESSVRMLVTEVLNELGYTSIEAADGSAGLTVLASNARIDLLITDVGLPGGINGRQMADAARRTRPDLKVLFITGYASSAAIGSGNLERGMHILTKPFAVEQLALRIKAIISEGYNKRQHSAYHLGVMLPWGGRIGLVPGTARIVVASVILLGTLAIPWAVLVHSG